MITTSDFKVIETIMKDDSKVPRVEGIIPISSSFRGQKYTRKGYRRDEVVSALQKSIRRCLVQESMYWFSELFKMGGPHRTNAINRLKIIVSEDISIVNAELVLYLKNVLFKVSELNNETKKLDLLLNLVYVMASSQKCRIVDNLICSVMGPDVKEIPKDVKINNFRGTKCLINDFRGDYKNGLKGDYEDLDEYMQFFVKALEKKDVKGACYWSQKVYDIPKPNTIGRKSRYGKSKDPIFAIWEILFKFYNNSKIMKFNPRMKVKNLNIINQLLNLFCDFKGSKSYADRLQLVHAIVHYCLYENVNFIDFKILKEMKRNELLNDETTMIIGMRTCAID